MHEGLKRVPMLRTRRAYSREFKMKMVEKMMTTNAASMAEVSRKLGVPESTLYAWRNDLTLEVMTSGGDDDSTAAAPAPTPQWSAAEKLAAVVEGASLPEAEFGVFLRRRGIHESQLREWQEQALAGLASPTRKSSVDDARRVKALERELTRKDKALAEAAALLLLKKKVLAIWGGGGDDTDPTNDT